MKPTEPGWVISLGLAGLGLMPLTPLAAQQPKLWKTLQAPKGVVGCVTFSPDGKTLAAKIGWRIDELEKDTIQLWDVSAGKVKSTIEVDGLLAASVTFSPDGKLFASASGPQSITFWDADSGKEKATVKIDSTDPVLTPSVAFSPDLKILASAWNKDTTIPLWDMTRGKLKMILKGHTRAVPSTSFSPDGKTLASVSWDKTVKLWDVPSGKEKITLEGHTDRVFSVAFGPDGKTLASGGGTKTFGELKLWDVREEREGRPERAFQLCDFHLVQSGWQGTSLGELG
jgi:WD40 repeat protein